MAVVGRWWGEARIFPSSISVSGARAGSSRRGVVGVGGTPNGWTPGSSIALLSISIAPPVSASSSVPIAVRFRILTAVVRWPRWRTSFPRPSPPHHHFATPISILPPVPVLLPLQRSVLPKRVELFTCVIIPGPHGAAVGRLLLLTLQLCQEVLLLAEPFLRCVVAVVDAREGENARVLERWEKGAVIAKVFGARAVVAAGFYGAEGRGGDSSSSCGGWGCLRELTPVLWGGKFGWVEWGVRRGS